MKSWAAQCDGEGLRVGIVVARFNHLVSTRLLEACVAELERRGVAPDDVHVAWVPGAFEIPLAARSLAGTGRYDALISLGSVIRGGTPHFDYVCQGVTDGVREVSLSRRVPIAFCVLTTETVDQALDRACPVGEDGVNKGAEAADVAVEMARLLAELKGGG